MESQKSVTYSALFILCVYTGKQLQRKKFEFEFETV